MSGKLFIISTPIGNLGDLSSRTKEALSQSDILLVEDTRVTIKLLNHLGLSKKMVSCHKFNEQSRLDIVRNAAENGQTVALVSDAGTPIISDPGHRVVACALELGMTVVPIPGPTALIQALVASGLPCERFAFEGFLKDSESDLRKQLEPLREDSRTLIFYISPHGLERKLSVLRSIFGERRACLARELTKLNEEYIRAPLSELEDHLSPENLRGEFTLLI
ncbi:MAG: 16S rRNA (cytidine(1402)-2'-O)-methyltransferase, partial [Cyanobacteria bacterium]|nr:16S rRNA (cytidine(1402)-2'-O)-methyltransferase [Cyanobacteriota bacterium]